MELLINILSSILLFIGVFLGISGAIGLFRLISIQECMLQESLIPFVPLVLFLD